MRNVLKNFIFAVVFSKQNQETLWLTQLECYSFNVFESNFEFFKFSRSFKTTPLP